MRIKRDIVEEWLKQNDPEYKTGRCYLNNRRFRQVVEEREIPTNRLDKINRRACV